VSRYQTLLIRAGLVYLLLTGVLGVVFFIYPAAAPYFRVTHVHLGLVGFMLSLVMGVAYWLMPRPGGLQQERLEAVTFWLLNTGLPLRVLLEPFWRSGGQEWLQAGLAAAGLLQLGAITVFVLAMHQRVRTKEAIWALRGVKKDD
jgi:cbb3-type cytochrome oxidase subunit 1